MTRVIARIASTSLFWLTALLCLAIALFSARFLLPQPFMADAMAPHFEARPLVFLIHVGGGLTALALGAFQLVTSEGPRRVWHRWAGRIYAAAALIGAVTGVWLALWSIGGPVAGLGFGLLGVVWGVTTAMGWVRAAAGRFSEHRRWMIRSLSVTFAAVTLRIMLPLAIAAGLDFPGAYRAISFLCWIPNLLLAEVWLRIWGWEPAQPLARGR